MHGKSGWYDLGGKVFLSMVMGFWFVKVCIAADPAKSGEDCISCHSDVWRDIQNKRYVHKPVGKGDCKYCHIAVQKEQESRGKVYQDKIKWVAKGNNPGRDHWLEFSDAKRGATLLVEARSGSRLKVKEYPLPAFDELEELSLSNQGPPAISNVRLLEATRGIFVSATIAWETDVPADSQVFYGLDKLDHSSMLDRQAVTNHAVVLTGVQPGKTYKYKVVSLGVAGTRSESAINSATIEVAAVKRQEQAGRPDGSEPEIKVRCYRRGDRTLAVISADREVVVQLGILPKKYGDERSGDEPRVVRHLPTNSPTETNIGVCYTCHVEYQKILTHPINVYPRPGMTIPPEYATLPDGRISCMSCHATHASNLEFRLIKANKRDLCRGCHQDMQ